jgi:hypothetical protein
LTGELRCAVNPASGQKVREVLVAIMQDNAQPEPQFGDGQGTIKRV